jgi:hypothetical protein
MQGGDHLRAQEAYRAFTPSLQGGGRGVGLFGGKFENGKKTEPARITVRHYEIKIHDDVPSHADNTTTGRWPNTCYIFRNVELLKQYVPAANGRRGPNG